MNDTAIFGGGLMLVAGATVAAVAVRARRASGLLAYLEDSSDGAGLALGGGDQAGAEEFDPFVERLLRPFAQGLTGKIRDLYPSSHLDRLHARLLQAGLVGRMRAEEFATIQVIAGVLGFLLGGALLFMAGGSGVMKGALVILLLAASLLGPRAWLGHKVDGRKRSIERELPDMLDLLTISVEAGLGLEAAIETASADGTSPLAEELARTIQEMSLGLSRHQALDNLKTRVSAPDLQTFVLVLTQADSLGMPIGRVLRTQADEMRERRRARAREQAAKLPVKILFPLMAFILPPLMIVVLGPAVQSIMKMFKQIG